MTKFASAQATVPYESISVMLNLADGKKVIEEVSYAPLYIKSKNDKIDPTVFKFSLMSADLAKSKDLNYEILKEVEIEELSLHDLNHLEEGYIVKLWVAVDNAKYQNWNLTHNQVKGSITVAFAKTLATNINVEEKRDEYRKKLADEGKAR